MDSKKSREIRQQLLSEYEKMIRSINRNRLAVEEIKLDNTEDEGDRASFSHDRDLLYNLHGGAFARLRFIQEAIKALDRGQYGECVRCRKDINEKRLKAMPWATMCIRCQDDSEAQHNLSRMVPAGLEAEGTE
jgi:DnaK suppressor protein